MSKKLRAIAVSKEDSLKKLAHSKGDLEFIKAHMDGRNSVKSDNDKPTELGYSFGSGGVGVYNRPEKHDGYDPTDDSTYDSYVKEEQNENGDGKYKVNYIHPDKKNIGNDRFESIHQARRYAKALKRRGYHDVHVTESKAYAEVWRDLANSLHDDMYDYYPKHSASVSGPKKKNKTAQSYTVYKYLRDRKARQKKLDEGRIEELSKETLGSYVKKNGPDKARLSRAAAQSGDKNLAHKFQNRMDGLNRALPKLAKKKACNKSLFKLNEGKLISKLKSILKYKEKGSKSLSSLAKKAAGEKKPVLAEISKATLASYISKATSDMKYNAKVAGKGPDFERDDDRVRPHFKPTQAGVEKYKQYAAKRALKRFKGLGHASNKLSEDRKAFIREGFFKDLKKATGATTNLGAVGAGLATVGTTAAAGALVGGGGFAVPGATIGALYALKTLRDRMKEAKAASVNEDVQLDELSSKTLYSYLNKAHDDKDVQERRAKNATRRAVESKGKAKDAHWKDAGKASHAYDKRTLGIERAKDRAFNDVMRVAPSLRRKSYSLTEDWDKMSHEAKELVLHADNDYNLHQTSHQPIMANLHRKAAKGKYDHEKSKQLWLYHADRAAQNYAKTVHGAHEFLDKPAGAPWHKLFSVGARREAAKHWADYHKDEFENHKTIKETFRAKANIISEGMKPQAPEKTKDTPLYKASKSELKEHVKAKLEREE